MKKLEPTNTYETPRGVLVSGGIVGGVLELTDATGTRRISKAELRAKSETVVVFQGARRIAEIYAAGLSGRAFFFPATRRDRAVLMTM